MRSPGVLTRTVVVVLVVAAAGNTLPAGQPRFASRVDAVNVDVLVTNGGRPVPGLEAHHFEVRDNGIVQRVTLIDTTSVPLDVSCVVGAAWRRDGVDQLPALRSAGDALREAIRPGDHVQVVPFTAPIHVQEVGSGDQVSIEPWIGSFSPRRGMDHMRDALFVALAGRHVHPGRYLLIALSDGVDTRSWLTKDQLRAVVRRTDTVIYVLQPPVSRWRYWVDQGFLEDLADDTGGRVMKAGQEGLRTSMARLFEEHRARYVLTFEPRGVATPGWHTLEVTLRGVAGKVFARRGYHVE